MMETTPGVGYGTIAKLIKYCELKENDCNTCSIGLVDHWLYNSSSSIDKPGRIENETVRAET